MNWRLYRSRFLKTNTTFCNIFQDLQHFAECYPSFCRISWFCKETWNECRRQRESFLEGNTCRVTEMKHPLPFWGEGSSRSRACEIRAFDCMPNHYPPRRAFILLFLLSIVFVYENLKEKCSMEIDSSMVFVLKIFSVIFSLDFDKRFLWFYDFQKDTVNINPDNNLHILWKMITEMFLDKTFLSKKRK